MEPVTDAGAAPVASEDNANHPETIEHVLARRVFQTPERADVIASVLNTVHALDRGELSGPVPVLGLTGLPGVGKSRFLKALARAVQRAGRAGTVAVYVSAKMWIRTENEGDTLERVVAWVRDDDDSQRVGNAIATGATRLLLLVDDINAGGSMVHLPNIVSSLLATDNVPGGRQIAAVICGKHRMDDFVATTRPWPDQTRRIAGPLVFPAIASMESMRLWVAEITREAVAEGGHGVAARTAALLESNVMSTQHPLYECWVKSRGILTDLIDFCHTGDYSTKDRQIHAEQLRRDDMVLAVMYEHRIRPLITDGELHAIEEVFAKAVMTHADAVQALEQKGLARMKAEFAVRCAVEDWQVRIDTTGPDAMLLLWAPADVVALFGVHYADYAKKSATA